MPVIQPDKAYTYSNYFEMGIDAIDLCEYFGYSLLIAPLVLPRFEALIEELAVLTRRLERTLSRLISRNEQAKREMLVAPLIDTIAEYSNAQIRIEYPIKVSHQLQGTLDYLLSVPNLRELIVIEAKRDDLDYGFTQLCAELIALDQWERSPDKMHQPFLLGAVTTGTTWQFGRLDRTQQQIQQDIKIYTTPDQLEAIVRILIQALLNEAD